MANNVIYVLPRNRKLQETGKEKTIHQSLKFILILTQSFALFPVEGISNQDVAALKFRWMSWKSFYSIFYAICVISLLVIQVLVFTKDGFYFLDAKVLIFYTSTLITILLFIRLAMKWPNLMKKWVALDASCKFGKASKLDLRLNTMALIVLVFALAEYCSPTVNRWLIRHYKCHKIKSSANLFDDFLKTNANVGIFKIVEYSTVLGILLQIIRVFSSFAWSFVDLFIGLISSLVALRFKQLNTYVEDSIKTKVRDIEFWRNVREDYDKLCSLTNYIIDIFSNITLFSYACNLYFTLVQLFHILWYRDIIWLQIYYCILFLLIIVRTVCVSLYASRVNDESKNICHVLHKASSKIYNFEISRLIDQCHFSEIALTGINFFYITRGIILSMAGAMVTYELALIQFNGIFLRPDDEDCL